MANEHIAVAMARDSRLDQRHKAIFERATVLACKEQYLARRETGDDGTRVTFDCDRGEIRVIVDIAREAKGERTETLDLRIIELGLLVFHVTGRRVTSERGRQMTAAKVHAYIPSYWEAILRFIS
ncbi:MAG TPA: hypothetical protein VLC10_01900 [Patescibacteria group bacterium]|nr:hypothetical protein [Patescibacteria group bacterium]